MRPTRIALIAMTALLLSSAPVVAETTLLLSSAPMVAEETGPAPAGEDTCALVQVSTWQFPFVSVHPDCLERPGPQP